MLETKECTEGRRLETEVKKQNSNCFCLILPKNNNWKSKTNAEKYIYKNLCTNLKKHT